MVSSEEAIFRPKYRTSVTAAIIVAAFVAVILWSYRIHLWWWCTQIAFSTETLDAIPMRPMPVLSVPGNEWKQHRFDRVAIWLPAGFSEDIESSTPTVRKFFDGDQAVLVLLPDVMDDSLFMMESEMSIPRESFTIPSFRAACYSVRSADFRWTMTRQEVLWHAYRINYRRLLDGWAKGNVEVFYDENLDGMLHLYSDRASYDWQSKGANASLHGTIDFRFKKDDPDLIWLRIVCQNVEVFGRSVR